MVLVRFSITFGTCIISYYLLLQLVKAHDGRQEFYPIPPKVVAPNLQKRGPEMSVMERSANVLRNIERDQWQTTYDRSHTGLGPANPNKLDNLSEKTSFYDTYGITDDNLVSTVSSRYFRVEVHLKLLISQSISSGARKFIFRYQQLKIKGVEMKVKTILFEISGSRYRDLTVFCVNVFTKGFKCRF